MKKFCDVCGKEVKTKVIVKNETYEVFGDEIEVDAKVLTCSECGEELFSEELDNATLVRAYEIYRSRHKLLSPEEIKDIRERYGLSQRSFAKLLNWGDKTVFRYENGSVQDKTHNSLMLFLRDPDNMRSYLIDNETALTEKQVQRVLAYAAKYEEDLNARMSRSIIDRLFTQAPSEENGYKEFDYDKFCAMVLYFAHKNKDLLKTKLMKLLNYSDMVFYKENGISISGVRYAHLPYGPVPENFDILMGAMEADHVVHIEVAFDNGYEKHQVIPDKDLSDVILTEEEKSVLERVYKKFKKFGSVDISEYSHKEKGYLSTKTGEIISYAYSKDIVL